MRARNHLVTVCMAVNREPHLRPVLENMAARAHDKRNVMFILWYDGDPASHNYTSEVCGVPVFAGTNDQQAGVGYSRHRAIMLVEDGVIVITDPHVNVPDGWDMVIREHFSDPDAKQDVVCTKTRCVSDFASLMRDDWTGQYGGADFVLYGDDGKHFCSPLAKWANHKPGEIPCVMGGFYAFTREWYRRIGEPLFALRGWGGDEEMLSVGSWLCGGRVVLLDMTVAHLLKASVPASPRYVIESAINRIRLPFLLPASDGLKEQMVNWVFNNPITLSQDFLARFSKDAERNEVAYLKTLWLQHRDAWPEFAKRFLGVIDVGAYAPSKPEVSSGIVTRHVLATCPSCGKIDSLRATRYMGNTRYCVCACGQHAKAVYEGNVLTVYWMPKKQKKRRKELTETRK